MTYLSEAHSEWHTVNGNAGCPLDCALSDPWVDPVEYMSDEELAEYDAWAVAGAAEREALRNTDFDPWADPDFLPGGKDFEPPF